MSWTRRYLRSILTRQNRGAALLYVMAVMLTLVLIASSAISYVSQTNKGNLYQQYQVEAYDAADAGMKAGLQLLQVPLSTVSTYINNNHIITDSKSNSSPPLELTDSNYPDYTLLSNRYKVKLYIDDFSDAGNQSTYYYHVVAVGYYGINANQLDSTNLAALTSDSQKHAIRTLVAKVTANYDVGTGNFLNMKVSQLAACQSNDPSIPGADPSNCLSNATTVGVGQVSSSPTDYVFWTTQISVNQQSTYDFASNGNIMTSSINFKNTNPQVSGNPTIYVAGDFTLQNTTIGSPTSPPIHFVVAGNVIVKGGNSAIYGTLTYAGTLSVSGSGSKLYVSGGITHDPSIKINQPSYTFNPANDSYYEQDYTSPVQLSPATQYYHLKSQGMTVAGSQDPSMYIVIVSDYSVTINTTVHGMIFAPGQTVTLNNNFTGVIYANNVVLGSSNIVVTHEDPPSTVKLPWN